jgi:hypothetical protein
MMGSGVIQMVGIGGIVFVMALGSVLGTWFVVLCSSLWKTEKTK